MAGPTDRSLKECRSASKPQAKRTIGYCRCKLNLTIENAPAQPPSSAQYPKIKNDSVSRRAGVLNITPSSVRFGVTRLSKRQGFSMMCQDIIATTTVSGKEKQKLKNQVCSSDGESITTSLLDRVSEKVDAVGVTPRPKRRGNRSRDNPRKGHAVDHRNHGQKWLTRAPEASAKLLRWRPSRQATEL